MCHHPKERPSISLVKAREFIIGEVGKVVPNAESERVFDDVVELKERAVLCALRESALQDPILGADVPSVGHVVVEPVDPEHVVAHD